MVDKIGLPPNIAEYFARYYDKRFMLYWATALQSALEDTNKHWYEQLSEWTYEKFVGISIISDFRSIEAFIKQTNLPSLPKEDLKRFKDYSSFGSISGMVDYVHEIVEKYVSIKDYAEATNQNFQNADFEEVYQESVEWHEELEASGRQLDIEEGQVIVEQYDDGYYWLDLMDNNCQLEGQSMGHCGNTSADTLLSLRDPKGEPHVTIAYDYDGTYRQIKGKGNDKPVDKYHEYIVDLFINSHSPAPESGESNEIYQLVNYKPEYKPETDFSISDLDDDLFSKLKDGMDRKDFIEILKEGTHDVVEAFNILKDELTDVELAEVLEVNFRNIDDLLETGGESSNPRKKSTKRYTVDYSKEIRDHGDDHDRLLKVLQTTDVINKYSEEEIIAVFQRSSVIEDDTEKIAKLVPYFRNDDYEIIKHNLGMNVVYTAKKK